MRRWAARAAALFCLAFAAFQIGLALGAPFGHIAWGGSSAVLPSPMRLASAGAAAYLVVAAGLMTVRAGDWGLRLPGWPFLVFNIVLAAQLALNTVANLAARSAEERYGMGAASALGCLLCVTALWPGRKT
ncbi:MAG TPA: hypothetical protein VFE10_03850 [Phenylobacterium sp.]|nr:hypothetical protein [Phenylobacterium sp.]